MAEQQPQLDYSEIARHIGAASIVGIGESTHGTHEFFEAKAEIFKALVMDHGFDTFFLESLDDRCEPINTYLQTGDGDIEGVVSKLFYAYGTEELVGLLHWLREHHEAHPVNLIGLDERKYTADYQDNYNAKKANARDERMARVVKRYLDANPSSKGMIWAHDAHIVAYLSLPPAAEGIEDRRVSMGEHLRKWFGDDYCSIGQLFGRGYFNAVLIDESDEFDTTTLVRHYARKPSKYFWENLLSKHLSQPAFLERPDFADLIEKNEVRYQRGLGWGVKRSIMHDQANVIYIDISKAYDGLLFFPQATASHLLARERSG